MQFYHLLNMKAILHTEVNMLAYFYIKNEILKPQEIEFFQSFPELTDTLILELSLLRLLLHMYSVRDIGYVGHLRNYILIPNKASSNDFFKCNSSQQLKNQNLKSSTRTQYNLKVH